MRFKTILIAAALTAFAGSAMAATGPDANSDQSKIHAKKVMQLAGCQHQRGKASGGGATGGGSSTGT